MLALPCPSVQHPSTPPTSEGGGKSGGEEVSVLILCLSASLMKHNWHALHRARARAGERDSSVTIPLSADKTLPIAAGWIHPRTEFLSLVAEHAKQQF